MKKRNILISTIGAIIVVAVFVVVFVKKSPPKYYTRYGVYIGTDVKIIYATRKGNAKTVINKMFGEFQKYEHIFDPWLFGSELYKLNHSNGKWVKVSPVLLKAIKDAMWLAKLTNGEFDPTIGRLVPLWGFNTDDVKKWHLPSKKAVDRALKHVGYKNVEIEGNKVRLLNGVWLDLNGIMEGYITEMLVKLARENDPNSSGVVDVGGTVGVIGPKYGDKPWIISIRDPRGNPNKAIAYLKLYKGFVGTSGDYERYIIVNGKRYYHIFDPKTGYSNDYLESVTTVSTNAILSDGFGVFSMVAGPSAMKEMAKKLGVAYYAINEQGKVLKNASWKKYEYKP